MLPTRDKPIYSKSEETMEIVNHLEELKMENLVAESLKDYFLKHARVTAREIMTHILNIFNRILPNRNNHTTSLINEKLNKYQDDASKLVKIAQILDSIKYLPTLEQAELQNTYLECKQLANVN